MISIEALVLMLVGLFLQVQGECVITWNDNVVEGMDLDGTCYYALEEGRGFSWSRASEQCESIGGELAEIRNVDTMDAVKAYISELPTWESRNYKQFWLGQTFNY